MSGRAAYHSGADVYLGANEAQALVGRWQGGSVGSDFTITDWGRGARERSDRERREREEREERNRWGRDRDRSWWEQHGGGRRCGTDTNQGRGQWPGWSPPLPQPTTAPGGFDVSSVFRPQGPQIGDFFGGNANVRDHRRNAWNSMGSGVPFEHVEALMTVVQASAPAPEHGAYRPLGGGGGIPPRAWLRDMPDPDMANRQVLPMNTGTTPVPFASTAQITSRPQRVAFRPERVFVSSADVGGSGSAANWIINDITIGNRSQFAQSGALPGDMFSNVAIDSFVTFETAQTAMDVVMIVTYQGPTEAGTPFYGSIIGTAAV